MATCIVCRCEVPIGRVNFLAKNNKPITCTLHSTTEKVGVYMCVTGKTDRQLVVTDAASAEAIHKMSKRAGMGISKGVKMSQLFQSKIFK